LRARSVSGRAKAELAAKADPDMVVNYREPDAALAQAARDISAAASVRQGCVSLAPSVLWWRLAAAA
jgi:hypothetical protein